MIQDAKYLFIDGDTAIHLEGHLVECLAQLDEIDLKVRKSFLIRHYQGLQTAMVWDISQVTQSIQSNGYALLSAEQAGRVLGVLVSLKSFLGLKDVDWLYDLQDKAFTCMMKNADAAKAASDKEALGLGKQGSSTQKIPVYSTRCV